jgi:hypothetical protein
MQLSIIKFGEANYEELASYAILYIGVVLVMYFGLFVEGNKPAVSAPKLPVKANNERGKIYSFI